MPLNAKAQKRVTGRISKIVSNMSCEHIIINGLDGVVYEAVIYLDHGMKTGDFAHICAYQLNARELSSMFLIAKDKSAVQLDVIDEYSVLREEFIYI